MAIGATTGETLENLYRRLAEAGLSRESIAASFPSWWDDELASDQAGFARIIGFIHTYFGISLEQLWHSESSIQCPPCVVGFKRVAGVTEDDVKWARCVAVSAARAAIAALPRVQSTKPHSAANIRAMILSEKGHAIRLHDLLDFLWLNGIPVLHIKEFPGRKMDALAVRISGRGAIILAKNHSHSSRSLFDLAHEAGHLFCGHLPDDGVLIDTDISREDLSDTQELEANEFATELLTGNRKTKFIPYVFNGKQLAKKAIIEGHRLTVDPAVLAQNYGFHKKNFGFANKACEALNDGRNPVRVINDKLNANLPFDDMSSDDAEFISRVTGLGENEAMSD